MVNRSSIGAVGGLALVLPAAAWLLVAGCKDADEAPGLSKASEPIDISKIPTPPADGPKIGATADVTPVLARPEVGAKQVGYLHAGAQVPRSAEPVTAEGCEGGWYAVRPRGFVCAGKGATTDLQHPTLVAMSLQPRRDQPLPYTYARVQKSTQLFKRDPDRDKGVVAERKFSRRSGLAVVGSWVAQDEEQQEQRLGLLTNGLFVPASDLKAAEPSTFQGVELDQGRGDLPIAFVVKRGVRRWKFDEKDDEYDKGAELEFHEMLDLTGRFREKNGNKYWAVADGSYVRHRDVTAVRRRNEFPDFATGDQRWIDVSIITGTAILYEGKKPVFATLVSVGRDRLGDPKETASTAQGDFEVVAKHVTATKFDPKAMSEYYEVLDVPWVLELSSGQLMHAAYWHDRFGIEYGPGHVSLAPQDAQRVWSWATPTVPPGWHGVTERPEREAKTIVRIRK